MDDFLVKHGSAFEACVSEFAKFQKYVLEAMLGCAVPTLAVKNISLTWIDFEYVGKYFRLTLDYEVAAIDGEGAAYLTSYLRPQNEENFRANFLTVFEFCSGSPKGITSDSAWKLFCQIVAQSVLAANDE